MRADIGANQLSGDKGLVVLYLKAQQAEDRQLTRATEQMAPDQMGVDTFAGKHLLQQLALHQVLRLVDSLHRRPLYSFSLRTSSIHSSP